MQPQVHAIHGRRFSSWQLELTGNVTFGMTGQTRTTEGNRGWPMLGGDITRNQDVSHGFRDEDAQIDDGLRDRPYFNRVLSRQLTSQQNPGTRLAPQVFRGKGPWRSPD